ncbi:serine hydrolase [Snodgrassella sp. CFCC 13594]|uniref:serine hydrolase domain-containing protein n=1 Tax=Snodgrassella sp. CFCC 13594 TaxID=1775559 RepID=UPI0018D38A6D|nr:serine hydrolase domain-containing protein [Snodgrassella sp. CFCC 13594]
MKKWFVDSVQSVHATAAQWAELKQGQLHACQYGWEYWPYISPPVNNDSIFAYASLTKLITAELIFQQIRMQQLSLNDPVANRLLTQKVRMGNWVDNRAKAITIGDLLSHRMGVDRTIQGDVMAAPNSWCPDHLLALASLQLNSNAGQRFAYSNLGYCLLGSVLTVSTKQSVEHLMTSGPYSQSSFVFLWQAQSHDAINWVIYPFGRSNTNDDLRVWHNATASGSLKGSAKSLLLALDNASRQSAPNIFSSFSERQIRCGLDNLRGCHGLAMYEFSSKNDQYFWKDGSLPETTAVTLIRPRHQELMVFLANGGAINASKVRNEKIVRDYLQAN